MGTRSDGQGRRKRPAASQETRMTRAEAWSYLADVWEAAYRARRSKATGPEGREWHGVCAGVYFLRGKRWITRYTYRAMLRTLGRMVVQSDRRDWFAWPKTVKGAQQRALFCRQMAQEAARRAPRRTAHAKVA
jgi:hypothetical protein